MKLAKVTPIYKNDAHDEFSNYRPISLLPNLPKILEKLMFNRLTDFVNRHEILYEQQYGFRQNFSTDLALIELSDKIAEAIDNKKHMMGIFIDLSKAFDTLFYCKNCQIMASEVLQMIGSKTTWQTESNM